MFLSALQCAGQQRTNLTDLKIKHYCYLFRREKNLLVAVYIPVLLRMCHPQCHPPLIALVSLTEVVLVCARRLETSSKSSDPAFPAAAVFLECHVVVEIHSIEITCIRFKKISLGLMHRTAVHKLLLPVSAVLCVWNSRVF